MKKIDKNLIGKLVVYYEPYGRDIIETAKVASVTSVGPKYITVGKLKFDKDTLSCPDSNYRLYLGNHEEFSEALGLMAKIRHQLNTLSERYGLDIPVDILRSVNEILAEAVNKVAP